LKGTYSRTEIHAIYRRCGIYFLAWPESFGMPICEVQACGGLVFTPTNEWCAAHCDDSKFPGPDFLPENIVVYGKNEDLLVSLLAARKESFSRIRNFKNFMRDQPHLYFGRGSTVSDFMRRVESGEIDSASHLKNPTLEELREY
jgi:hypothetical protein